MPPPEARAGSTRRDPHVLLGIALLLLVARVVLGFTQGSEAAPAEDLVEWRAIGAGESEAARTGKPMLYDFTADWCAPCRRMRRELFANPQAAQFISDNFVPIQVLDRTREEGRNGSEVQALLERYEVRAFPTLVVAPATGGRPVYVKGYPGKDATLQALVSALASTRAGD